MLQECLRNNYYAHYTRKCLAGKVSKSMYKILCGRMEFGWGYVLYVFLSPFLSVFNSTFRTASSGYLCAYHSCIRSDCIYISHTTSYWKYHCFDQRVRIVCPHYKFPFKPKVIPWKCAFWGGCLLFTLCMTMKYVDETVSDILVWLLHFYVQRMDIFSRNRPCYMMTDRSWI